LLLLISYNYTSRINVWMNNEKPDLKIMVHTSKWKCPFPTGDSVLCAMQPDSPYPTMTTWLLMLPTYKILTPTHFPWLSP
jgi:hypothetical protein